MTGDGSDGVAELLARLDSLDAKVTHLLASNAGVDPEFTEAEVAAIWNVSIHSVQRYRYKGQNGTKLRFYRRGDLVRIGASHMREFQAAIEVPQRKREGLKLVQQS